MLSKLCIPARRKRTGKGPSTYYVSMKREGEVKRQRELLRAIVLKGGGVGIGIPIIACLCIKWTVPK